jgi:hypothetical protein
MSILPRGMGPMTCKPTGAALALTQFLGSKVESSPITHLLKLLIALLILLGLSEITWKWLGGRESN